jgi:hypothetical protein
MQPNGRSHCRSAFRKTELDTEHRRSSYQKMMARAWERKTLPQRLTASPVSRPATTCRSPNGGANAVARRREFDAQKKVARGLHESAA